MTPLERLLNSAEGICTRLFRLKWFTISSIVGRKHETETVYFLYTCVMWTRTARVEEF